MTKQKIDTKWFVEALKQHRISQRGLARLMGRDIWSIWHMLQGNRRMQADEASRIADLIGVPLTEVLRRAGVQSNERMIQVMGTVRGSGAAVSLAQKPIDQTLGPPDLPANAIALLCKTTRTPLDFAEGCLLFTYLTDRVENAAIGRLSIVCPVDVAEPMIRLVKRGSRAGTYKLVLLNEEPAVSLQWAAPISWIRT